MGSVCSLVRVSKDAPNINGFSEESWNNMTSLWENLFYEALDASDYCQDAKKFQRLFKKALATFGEKMHAKDLDTMVKYVESYLETSDLGFAEWVKNYYPSEGLRNAMSKKYLASISESQEQYDEDVDETDDYRPAKFLDSTFGNKANLKNVLKQKVTRSLIQTFVVDRINGRLIPNATEANKQAREQKQKLFDIVCQYLEIKDNQELFDEGGNYTGAFDSTEFKEAMRNHGSFEVLSPDDIELLASGQSQRYAAFEAWYILKNYDNFVNLILGSAVNIHPNAKGKLADGDVYSYADKHGSNITSWRTDDNTVMSQVISKLPQALIATTPKLSFDVENTTDSFLKFEDFYRVITKLKELGLSGNSLLSMPISDNANIQLTNLERKLVGNHSIREIINLIRQNPQLYTRLALKCLVSNKGSLLTDLGFDREDKDKLYSIYKGIYSDEDKSSLNYIQNQLVGGKKLYDHNAQNYYTMVSQVADSMFSVGFLQYNEQNGIILVRTLNDLGSDNVQRNLEQGIYHLNSRKIIGSEFMTRHMDPYKAKPIVELDLTISGLSCQLGDYTLLLTYSGDKLDVLNANDESITLNNDTPNIDILKGFINALLGLNLGYDMAMEEALEKEFPNGYIKDLLHLSSIVLLNKYISNVRLKNVKGYSSTTAKLAGIYKNAQYKPGFNYDLNEINLIPENKLSIVRRIAQAKTRVTGEALATQVRTADGDMLSQQTLSRLVGNLAFQHELIRSNGGACQYFSLLKPGLYKGHYTSKELKSSLGNKAETQFTVAELTQGAFLYDFVQGLMPDTGKSGKSVYGNGVCGFYPSVNSDKGTIGRIVIDLSLTDGQDRKFIDLTYDEILDDICHELGSAYDASYAKIKKDYVKLLLFCPANIDPDDNFKDLNEYAASIGRKPALLLYEWTRQYNNEHRNAPILLIENVHYTKGEGNNILFNNTFRQLRERYEYPARLFKFMKYKEAEILASLLNENVLFNLTQEDSTDKLTPKKWLLENYKDWAGVHDTDLNGNITRTIENGRMVMAHLHYKGATYCITSKLDLINFANEAGVDPNLLLNSPHTLLRYGLELHPLMAKYNAYEYLFTQEYMMSGVGSHVAHPSKAKMKAPIIWGHPAIGKTFSRHGNYANWYIDWDEEFNRKRDVWIAKQSNTEIGTPEFKAARNEYLINWALHDDFKDFVKKEWARVKDKANAQNKMLIASPAMLISMFANDFDKVITMSADDFIDRAVARGDRDPVAWKLGIDAHLQFVPNNKKVQIEKGLYLEDLFDNGTFDKEFEQLDDNAMKEEAARFLAQHKRNVSYTAQMQEFQLGLLNGIPTEYNMAMMEDVPANTYTITGDTNVNDSYDGATFVNPFVVHWENNSLCSAKAGIDKKQFVHFYDVATGTGGIVKTAGFGVTNDRMRCYKFYRIMNHNMTQRTWINEDGTQHIMVGKGILSTYEGQKVDYGISYTRRGSQYFAIEINDYLGNNTYSITTTLVDEYGQPIPVKGELSLKTESVLVNSNYDIWEKLFGGMNSMDIVNGKLEYSESSIIKTAQAASNYGIVKPGHTPNTLDDVYLPMKHSDIHYMPTKGAVKQGACNINPWTVFFSKLNTGVNFMKVKMYQAGIQLDKEHHANNSVLSLMTLVISAACSRSLMPDASNRVYEALYELSKLGTSKFRDEMGKLQFGSEEKEVAFNNAVTDIIIKTILNSSSTDGDMMQSIALLIIQQMEREHIQKLDDNSLQEYDKIIPYSSPEIFRKVVSSLTSALTKKGIKTKMPGVLSVLCPAHDIVKFYTTVDPETGFKSKVTLDHFEQFYGISSDEELDAQLDQLLDEEPLIDDIANTEIGYKYLAKRVIGTDPVTGLPIEEDCVLHIVRPDSLLKEGQLTPYSISTSYHGNPVKVYQIGYADLKNMKSTILQLQEWNKDGLDLHSYQVKFLATFPDGSLANFLLGDLDVVLDYFKLKALSSKDKLPFIAKKLDYYGKRLEFIERITKDLSKDPAMDYESLKFLRHLIKAFVATLNTSWDENFMTTVRDVLNRASNDYPATVYSSDMMSESRYKARVVAATVQNIQDYLEKMGTCFMNRVMQITLNAISPTYPDDLVVKVDNLDITVLKNSIKIQPFGCIMPKVFKEYFGLDTYDNITDVLKDPDFFTKKLVKKLSTKIDFHPYSEEGSEHILWVNNFDLELKRNDGAHIYIRTDLNSRSADELSDLHNRVNWIKRIENDGRVYRIDGKGDIMYEMFSEHDVIYLDDSGAEVIVPHSQQGEVFVDDLGNEYTRASVIFLLNGSWALKTNRNIKVKQEFKNPITFYLNNFNYSAINISEHTPDAVYNTILQSIKNSTNKVALRMFNILSRFPDTDKLRQQIKRMNDYSGALGSESTHNNYLEHIYQLGQEMRTSFLQSLHLVAARIPSLNQQSFMALEVEAFDNPDVNTAMVSIFQFYLQGSDLDIDAVSLQTFDIDESGLFVGHSPYYSLLTPELRKASENLPFPNGRKVIYSEDRFKNSIFPRIREKYPEVFGALSPIRFLMIDNNPKLEVVLLNPEQCLVFAKFLKDVSDNGIVGVSTEDTELASGWLSKFVYGDFSHTFSKELIDSIVLQLVDIVDKHNLYIKTLNVPQKERLIKNYAVTQLYNIIIDPVNAEESWSSVDTVTAPVKQLASLSPKATVQTTFTPGNFMNKFQSLIENMVGKDGIAICATALKSFFALTQMYQRMLNDGTLPASAKDALLSEVVIGSKSYRGLSNAFTSKFKSAYEGGTPNLEEFSNLMTEFLSELLWALDAANDMSALLGLSADNAKELVLAKINAGTATLGMYLYGMALGVPMSTLYDIINSPLGRRLTELTKGDWFNEDLGTRNIIGALQYLKTEPRIGKIGISIQDGKFVSVGEEFLKDLKRLLPELATSSRPILDACKNIDTLKQSIETLRAHHTVPVKLKDADKVNYEAQYQQIIDKVLTFIEDLQLLKGPQSNLRTVYGESKIYDNLEILATGAEEMKTCGKILHLNQEIYTSPDQLIDLVNTIENLIVNREKLINKLVARTTGRIIKPSALAFSLAKFMTDEDYAQGIIARYDAKMQSFNVLRVIHDDPNYRGYVETLLMAYQGLLNKSTKLDIIINRAYPFIDKYSVVDPKLQTEVTRNAENAFDTYVREKWMKDNNMKFTIGLYTAAEPTYVYIDNLKTPRPNYVVRDIKLGTPLGDANFKLWMERTMIPKWKKQYPDNKFIRDLLPIVSGNSDYGTKVVNFGLRIDMMPKATDEYATDLFNEYKESFSELSQKALEKNYSILDLLYIYSLISYRGKHGPRSLHGIFLDYNSNIVKSYRATVCAIDKYSPKERLEIMEYITDEMLAPRSTPKRGGSNLIKYIDKDTETPYILRIPENSEEDLYEGNPEGDPENSYSKFGEYLDITKIDDMDYSMFNTARSVTVPGAINVQKNIDISKYVENMPEHSIYLRPIIENEKIAGWVANSGSVSTPVTTELLLKLLTVPVIFTENPLTKELIVTPHMDLIQILLNDIINDCK